MRCSEFRTKCHLDTVRTRLATEALAMMLPLESSFAVAYTTAYNLVGAESQGITELGGRERRLRREVGVKRRTLFPTHTASSLVSACAIN